MRVRLNLVDFYKVSLASLAMEFFLLTRVFLFALPCGQKSRRSCKSFPAGFSSGCGDLNLVDFYKVSLASLAMIVFMAFFFNYFFR